MGFYSFHSTGIKFQRKEQKRGLPWSGLFKTMPFLKYPGLDLQCQLMLDKKMLAYPMAMHHCTVILILIVFCVQPLKCN